MPIPFPVRYIKLWIHWKPLYSEPSPVHITIFNPLPRVANWTLVILLIRPHGNFWCQVTLGDEHVKRSYKGSFRCMKRACDASKELGTPGGDAISAPVVRFWLMGWRRRWDSVSWNDRELEIHWSDGAKHAKTGLNMMYQPFVWICCMCYLCRVARDCQSGFPTCPRASFSNRSQKASL